jgi:thiamine-phosphate pyrophosphorylase
MDQIGIYAILTKPVLPYRTFAEKCVSHGVKMLQLREKNLSDKELIRIGKEIRSITRDTQTKFVINDRPDIALICQADYLHLGQDDFPIEEARKIVGDMKIGLSTHSLEQAREALLKKPDYIGFGPIYPTNAKSKPDLPVGINFLKEVIGFSNVPVVAIGGIFPENIQPVIDAGAVNIAVVRFLMQATEPDERILYLQKLLKRKI